MKAWAAPYALVLAFLSPDASAQTQYAATPSPQPQGHAASSDDTDADAIAVTGQRREGSVPGDAIPQIVLGPADIRSYGA